MLQRTAVHASLLSCWSRRNTPTSPRIPNAYPEICGIIPPVCSHLLLLPPPPRLPLPLPFLLPPCVTFRRSSPADRSALSANLPFPPPPPHTTHALSAPSLLPPESHTLLHPRLWLRPLDHFLPPPFSPLSCCLPLCPLQLNILCFLIRPTSRLRLPPASLPLPIRLCSPPPPTFPHIPFFFFFPPMFFFLSLSLSGGGSSSARRRAEKRGVTMEAGWREGGEEQDGEK